MRNLLAALCLLLALGTASQGQMMGPHVSDDFPFQVGLVMDGGTIAILSRAGPGIEEAKYCIDGRIYREKGRTRKANKELFKGALQPDEAGAALVPRAEALRIFEAMRGRLETYFGEAEFRRIEKLPPFTGNEAVGDERTFLSNQPLQNRLAAQMLLDAIKSYKGAR